MVYQRSFRDRLPCASHRPHTPPARHMNTTGLSLLEQKKIQWAREREEMVGLSGLWGSQEKCSRETPAPVVIRRNSLLPPIQSKVDEIKAEESETSGYISDSPQHDCESDGQWSRRADNYWADRKAQKNFRNESRVRQTPDSLLSTPEDRLKWGDRGVGVGHLWEPVIEIPESRLPQVFESFRATPRWVERGLKLADGNNADILYIQHDEEPGQSKFLLGQNVPLPPEILEERERKRQKALEHQTAIIKQLEERERKRKEEKEIRIREERLEEQRLLREQELERQRIEQEMKKIKEKEELERRKEEAMKEAIKAAESKARENKRKLKKQELERVNEKLETMKLMTKKTVREEVINKTVKNSFCQSQVEEIIQTVPINKPEKKHSSQFENFPKIMTDSSCQSEIPKIMTDSSSQSENLSGLEFVNVGGEGGLAFVLDGVPDAVQLALLMPQGPPSDCHSITSSQLRGVRVLADAATQTRGNCCSVTTNSVRSRRSHRQSSRASGRSDSSDKSTSLERQHTISHSHCCVNKQRSRSQPRLTMGERPKWGINRPSIQYLKQSEKDPHYMKKLKRRGRKSRENGERQIKEKMLESEFRLLAFQTDEEIERITEKSTEKKVDFENSSNVRNILANGFRMDSNPSSPRFIPIGNLGKESDIIYDSLNEEKKYEEETSINNSDLLLEETQSSSTSEELSKEIVVSNSNSSGFETELFPNSTNTTNVTDNTSPFDSKESTSPRSVSGSSNEDSYGGDHQNIVVSNDSNTSGFDTELFPDSTNTTNVTPPFSSEESTSPRSVSGSSNEDSYAGDHQGCLPPPDDVPSPPSSGRSEIKSSADEGDCDESGEEEKPENPPPLSANQREILSQITSLRLGLKRLENAAESRSSTPLSVLSLPDDLDP